MIPTYVVIPFKDEPEMTSSIFRQLREQGEYDYILAYDNGSSDETIKALHDDVRKDRNLRIFSRPDSGIYQMWNEGWRQAVVEAGGPVNIAFLNNDITIPPRFLSTLAHHLRANENTWAVYPDYRCRIEHGVADELTTVATHGTYQHGGMCGWAFMLQGEAINNGLQQVDEEFEWWYGDDDLVGKIVKNGKEVRRIVGFPLDHINEATANNGQNSWTHGAKGRDTERWRQKNS